MRTSVLFLLLFLIPASASAGIEGPHHFMLGVRPAITAEPHYPKGSLDLNTVPLVLELALGRHLGLRAASIVNLHLSQGVRPTLSHVGGEIHLPLYLLGSRANRPYRSLYIAPVFALSRNLMETLNNLTFAGEAGFSLGIANRLSLGFSAQLGGTRMWNRESTPRHVPHLGLHVTLGVWAF